jgi:hypothetical protein
MRPVAVVLVLLVETSHYPPVDAIQMPDAAVGVVQYTAQTPSFHIFLTGKPRMAVRDALDGAVRRLGKAECDRLFSDFRDANGQRPSAVLAASGATAGEYLARLYFVDADADRCRADEALAAFTTPGSRVVHICGDRFAERFARNIRGAEILLIHELLHTLGVGENPPSAATITASVYRRCGD